MKRNKLLLHLIVLLVILSIKDYNYELCLNLYFAYSGFLIGYYYKNLK